MFRLIVLAATMVLGASPAFAQGQRHPEGGCAIAARHAEASFELPRGLLQAIAIVESGGGVGTVAGEGNTLAINAGGRSFIMPTVANAILALQLLQASKVRFVDVGCFQVDLFYHPKAFAHIEAAFKPDENAAAAALYLRHLYKKSGDWNEALAQYHSATPLVGEQYRRRVMHVLKNLAAQQG